MQESIYDQFVEKLLTSVAALRIGPHDEASYGAITTHAQYERIQAFFEIAKRDGLTPATGGKVASNPEFGDGW